MYTSKTTDSYDREETKDSGTSSLTAPNRRGGGEPRELEPPGEQLRRGFCVGCQEP
uniref:Uncharacterized protein n=1 Tax=Arundo donax TaxID=35708 RepID=A0A0A9AFV9_ARUDO